MGPYIIVIPNSIGDKEITPHDYFGIKLTDHKRKGIQLKASFDLWNELVKKSKPILSIPISSNNKTQRCHSYLNVWFTEVWEPNIY